MACLSSGLPALSQSANCTLRALGASETAAVTLDRELFGTRYYDGFTLPGGYYEALRVTIGKGEGKNWWCVLYPSLCFAEISHGTMDTAAKEELEAVLDEDELELLYENKDGDKRERVYEFKIFTFLNKLIK